MDDERVAHAVRAARAAAQLRSAPAGPLALDKRTSNLFRDRAAGRRQRLDLQPMNHVLAHDAAGAWVDVEGATTYEQLVAATLQHGTMPAVVPQLKTITAGGAAAGVGIEATSFRHGLVHDTMLELEVLLPGGDVVVCTPGNDHRDLFFGFPNSYGTLGYALRLRLATLPVMPVVHVRHRRCGAGEFFPALEQACRGDADFVDGVVFSRDASVLSMGRFAAQGSWQSDYTYHDIYWQSLLARDEDYLGVQDWLWRWDTDWFWCSRNFGAQHALVRWLLGRERLNSRTYTRWMRFNARWQIAARLARWRGRTRESVIQDVDIPLANAGAFLDFLHREIGILPVWICPLRAERPDRRFPLYRLPAAPLYVNFGFWDAIETRQRVEPGHFNRLVEQEVLRLGGIKSLYSDSFFTREEFDAAYGGEAYRRLKARYDPGRRAPDLYDKCVLRA